VKNTEATTGPAGSGGFDRLGNRDEATNPVESEEGARVREESDRVNDVNDPFGDRPGDENALTGDRRDELDSDGDLRSGALDGEPGLSGRHDGTGLNDEPVVADEPGAGSGRSPLVAGHAGSGLDPDPEHGPDDAGTGERIGTAQPADLIVYPDKADQPDPADLTAPAVDVPEPEPVLVNAAAATDPGVVPPASPPAEGGVDYRQRWREVQAGFVDDPRDAVRQADELVDEAVNAVVRRKQELTDRWKDGDQGDTERLRVTLREYRSLLEELGDLVNYSAGSDDRPARDLVR
jgi:hypothetical protein